MAHIDWPSPTPTWHSSTYPSISPTRPELSAKGKNVLITGGGTGIGAETARSFAKAGAARIALLGRREQPLIETKESIESQFPGTQVFVAPTDITDKDQVDAAFARFLGRDGKLDVLVSGAAFGGPNDSFTRVDIDKFLNTVDINVRGSLHTAKAFVRHASAAAVAIEVNSNAAHVNFAPAYSAYSVAKLAVYRLWDTLALAEPGLRVYHVHPGVVDTDMNKEAGGIEALGYEDHGTWQKPSLIFFYWSMMIN